MKDRDVNEELDKLIIQYGIDRYYPKFAKKKQAIKLIDEFVSRNRDKKAVLVAGSSTDSNYMQEECFPSAMVKDIVLYEQIDEYPWQDKRSDLVVIVSFYGRKEAALRLNEYGIPFFSIYDYLAEHGLTLEGNYYDIFGEEYCSYWDSETTFDYDALDMNAIFFYDRRNYEIAEERPGKEMYLARMIFDCIYVKDWELMKRYIDDYIRLGYSYSEQYKEFAKKIEELISYIKEKLRTRQKDDIVMFWLDELEFGEDKDMPYFRSLAEKSIDFLNAYTVTPFTNSTAKTLFDKKNVVDDRTYRIKIDRECSLIHDMEEKGYRFCFYTFLTQVDNEIKGRKCQERCTTFSEMCWDMISDMLKSKEKLFIVLHEVYSTHFPYISFGLTGEDYLFLREKSRVLNSYEKMLGNKQMQESLKYVDDVLKQYCDFLPDNVYKIFMSDHGHTETDRYHTIFRIIYKNMVPQTINGIFSYINFDKLVYKMLNNESDYSDITAEYAQIQDVDYYEKNVIKKWLNNLDLLLKTDAFLWGWKGAISRKHVYVRYNDGRERYYNNIGENEIVTEGKIQYLRDLCTPYPSDIILDDKFKYSRNARRTFQNYMKRNGKRQEEIEQAVRDLFDRLSKSERIALRGGGEHTMQLWYTLKENQQKNILCVIDSDKKCKAARLGLKVIDTNEVYQEKIDTIIISSYKNEIEWYEELKKSAGDILVIGLYDYLRDMGIICEREFYKREYIKEDIVWEE